jgi:hypothetical protein
MNWGDWLQFRRCPFGFASLGHKIGYLMIDLPCWQELPQNPFGRAEASWLEFCRSSCFFEI